MQTCTPEWRTSFLKAVTPAIDSGVIGMQGKATDTRKTNIEKKKKKKKKGSIKSHLKKKSSTLIQLKCIWHFLAS